MDSGAISLTVVSFTLVVPSLIFSDKFSMICNLRCSWGTAVIWDSLSFSLNNLTVSVSGKRILNPSCTRCCNSPWMSSVILGVHAEAWGPFAMAHSRALYVQAGPVCTEIPLSVYSCSRRAARC